MKPSPHGSPPATAVETAPLAPPPATPPDAKTNSISLLLWLVGLLAVAGAAAYLLMLPGMHRTEAFALLDQIQITMEVPLEPDNQHKKMVQKQLVNPVTKKNTNLLCYVAFVGDNPSSDKPDLAARKHFIALCDLCGRDPHLAMEVMRKGLASPMDQNGYRRRLVANEMLMLLRDIHDRFPGDADLLLTMNDLYSVAQCQNAEQFVQGTARHAADILQLLLAFPAEFPDRLPVIDHSANNQYALARLIYLDPKEFGGKQFREPFVEQGSDMLLLLNTYKIEQFKWDDSLRRFLYTGVPINEKAAPEPAPTGTGTDPLKTLGKPGADSAVPAPPGPPPMPPQPTPTPTPPSNPPAQP